MASVGALLQAGHRVIWDCEVCRRIGDVDLVAIAVTHGEAFSLANRRPPCRQPGCPGRVRFRLSMGLWHRELDTLTERDPAWWAYQDAERARLIALGWRIEAGKWVGPVK